MRFPIRPSLALLLLLAACPQTEGTGPVVTHGDPSAAPPLDAMQYPWPTDLALKDGRVSVTLPDFGEERDFDATPFSEVLAGALAERAGFSGTAAVMFTFDKDIDEASARDAAFIVGLSGPHQGTRIRVRLAYRADGRRLFLSPHHGERLLGGERYAAVVTTKMKGTDGQAVRPSPGTRKLIGRCEDRAAPLGVAPSCGPAHPVVADALPRLGVGINEIAGLTTFTIERADVELGALRDALYAEPAPTLTRLDVFPKEGYDLDKLFGVPTSEGLGEANDAVPHASVAHVIHGSFRVPLFNSEVPGANGVMQFDRGVPRVRAHEDVAFTLVLPNTVTDVSALPLVVYQHGLGGQRGSVLVVAEELCRRGYAVVGIDLPFHGSRTAPLPARDARNNITELPHPDGIGDYAGLEHALRALGITSDTPGLVTMTPTIVRDSLRQGYADVFALVRAILDADAAPLVVGLAAFAGLGFDDERVYWLSESFGSIHGVPIVAMEPRLKGAVFSVGGGGLVIDMLMNSPTYGPPFGLFLYQAMGLGESLNADLTVNYEAHPPEREWRLQLYQHAIDVADPAAFAPLIARVPASAPRSALFLVSYADESVPNQSEESLAMQAGAHALRTGEGPRLRYAPMPIVDGEIRDNVNGAAVGFIQFDPAGHGMLTHRHEEALWEAEFPPFTRREPALSIENPTDQLHHTAADFLDSLGAGDAVIRLATP